MNIPNALTLFRILCVPVFVGLVLYGHPSTALGVFVAAGITDALDGMIARVLDQQTTLGRYLDPLADKLLLVSAVIVLSFESLIPIWVSIVVVSRDVIISVGSLVVHLLREHVDIAPTWIGKGTTVLQLAYVSVVLMTATTPLPAWLVQSVLAAMVVCTVVSGLHYVVRGVQMLSGQPGGRG